MTCQWVQQLPPLFECAADIYRERPTRKLFSLIFPRLVISQCAHGSLNTFIFFSQLMCSRSSLPLFIPFFLRFSFLFIFVAISLHFSSLPFSFSFQRFISLRLRQTARTYSLAKNGKYSVASLPLPTSHHRCLLLLLRSRLLFLILIFLFFLLFPPFFYLLLSSATKNLLDHVADAAGQRERKEVLSSLLCRYYLNARTPETKTTMTATTTRPAKNINAVASAETKRKMRDEGKLLYV